MSEVHYSIISNSYKNSVFAGFSVLQRNEEFTDLTLAADGHIVHVHKNIIALASPYLREMLKSLPSQSPVVFLNNVNHKVLSYLLEYIYQGEVNIPTDALDSFIQVSKSLHIIGIQDVSLPKEETPLTKLTVKSSDRGSSNIAAHISIDSHHKMQIQPNPQSGTSGSQIVYDAAECSVDLHNSNKVLNQEIDSPKKDTHTDIVSSDLTNIKGILEVGVKRNLRTRKRKTAKFTFKKSHSSKIQQSERNSESLKKNTVVDVGNQAFQVIPVVSVESTGTLQNIPVIEIQADNTNVGENFQTDTRQYHDYKLTVKSHNDTAQNTSITALPNTPVIDVQSISLKSQDDQSLPCQGNSPIPVIVGPTQYEMVTNQVQNNIQLQVFNQDMNNLQMAMVNQYSNNLYQDPSVLQMQLFSRDQMNINQDLHTVVNQDQNNTSRPRILDEQIIQGPTITSNTELAPRLDSIQAPLNTTGESQATNMACDTNLDALKHMAQYSMTEKGALHLILNRYIYSCHHSAKLGQKRRWRCIEYRKMSCRALVDTFDGAIIARKAVHIHPYHDDKIYQKHRKGLIFNTIKQADEAAKTKAGLIKKSSLPEESDNDIQEVNSVDAKHN